MQFNSFAELDHYSAPKLGYEYKLSRGKLRRIIGKTETINNMRPHYNYIYAADRLVEEKANEITKSIWEYDQNNNRIKE